MVGLLLEEFLGSRFALLGTSRRALGRKAWVQFSWAEPLEWLWRILEFHYSWLKRNEFSMLLIPEMLWLLFTQNFTFRKGKKKKKVMQEAKSTGGWKQKALFIQSALQIKQIQNKVKQDWVMHISNKFKEKNPIIFHSIAHQRTITTDYSMRWWLYPCPKGFLCLSCTALKIITFAPILHLSPHPVCPISNTSSSHSCLLTVSFYYPLIFTSCKRKKIHKTMHLIRCAWHITLHLSVHQSLPRFSFPKRSQVWAKSSQSSNPNPVGKEQMKVPLGPISSFSTDNQRGCCWASSALWQKSCTPSLNFIFSPWEVKS